MFNRNKTANDFNSIEIISEPMVADDSGDYMFSNLYVAHDRGRDKKFIRKYSQVQEIMNLSVGELFAEYIDEHQ